MSGWMKVLLNPLVTMLWLVSKLVRFCPPKQTLNLSIRDVCILILFGAITKGIGGYVMGQTEQAQIAFVVAALISYSLPLVFLLFLVDRVLIGLVVTVETLFTALGLLTLFTLPMSLSLDLYRLSEIFGVIASIGTAGLYFWWLHKQRRS